MERKGIGNVINAVADLSDVELVIAGGPPADLLATDHEANRFQRLAEELGVADRVRLLGALDRESVPAFLRSADVVACCPWYEPFGLVAVEAMACGVPVVASAVGGLAETVVHGVTGMHVAPRTPAAIRSALSAILDDDELRRNMGAAGARRAKSLRMGPDRGFHVERVPVAAQPPTGCGSAAGSGVGMTDDGLSNDPNRRDEPPAWAVDHIGALRDALDSASEALPRIERWGMRLYDVLHAGGRLLAAGNGGSAAQAQHVTAELVGRYRHERPAFSAIALHADTSTLTALANDYGVHEIYARQVRAHGHDGDVLLALSTSGRSANVVRAARAASELGVATWALTGAGPNPLGRVCDDVIAVTSEDTAVIQEVHQVLVHLLCEAFDRAAGVERDLAVVTASTSRDEYLDG